jgi:hypothetical protein
LLDNSKNLVISFAPGKYQQNAAYEPAKHFRKSPIGHVNFDRIFFAFSESLTPAKNDLEQSRVS